MNVPFKDLRDSHPKIKGIKIEKVSVESRTKGTPRWGLSGPVLESPTLRLADVPISEMILSSPVRSFTERLVGKMIPVDTQK